MPAQTSKPGPKEKQWLPSAAALLHPFACLVILIVHCHHGMAEHHLRLMVMTLQPDLLAYMDCCQSSEPQTHPVGLGACDEGEVVRQGAQMAPLSLRHALNITIQ